MLYRIDGGANCQVAIDPSTFIKLFIRKINCQLGLGNSSSFEGVGVQIISIPGYPNTFIILSPVYYSPQDDAPTLSTGALKKTKLFKDIIEHRHSKLVLVDNNDKTISIPTVTKNLIDYVNLRVHKAGPLYKQAHRPNHTQLLPPRCHAINIKPGSSYWSLVLHLKYGHRPLPVLQSMIDKGHIKVPKSFPKKLAPFPGRCPVCDMAGATKIPRGPCVDTTELPVGYRWHMDFTFFNKRSIRGFIASLTIIDAASRMTFEFPCRNKRPPIDICSYFFALMKKQDYACVCARMDEGGELAKSEEFILFMRDTLNMAVQTTGGDASSLNGMAEAPHKMIKKTTRALLITAGMSDTFWCFAMQYAVFLLVNSEHSVTKRLPIQHFSGGKNALPPSKVVIWGSKMRIIKAKKKNSALESRTGGDPREVFNYSTLAAPLKLTSHDGFFLGYGNNVAVMICYKPKTKRIVRCRHAIIDEHGATLQASDQPLSPSEYMLRYYPTIESDSAEFRAQLPQLEIKPSDLDFIQSPFDANKCISLEVVLPPKGTDHGVTFDLCQVSRTPIIVDVHPLSPLRPYIPSKCFRNHYVVSIDNIEPISADGTDELIRNLQIRKKTNQVNLVLHPTDKYSMSNYESYRAHHDGITVLRHNHIAACKEMPTVPKSIFAALDGPDRDIWMEALFHQYDKNQAVQLYAAPVPIESVPKGIKIIPSIIACSVKPHGEGQYKFNSRHCANGNDQVKGIDFENSYSPTASASSVRTTFAYASINYLILALLDVVNCFQSTLVPNSKRIVVRAPPLFMKWYRWRYPEHKYDESASGKYVIQILRGLQGDREIGRQWYLLLRTILVKFGCKQCPHELALYYWKRGEDILLINTSTDDFLCAFSRVEIFYELRDFVTKFVDVTTQEGPILKYLNLRIVQSQYGISFDQTEHIRDTILDPWLKNSKERVKGFHTPWPTDRAAEKEIAEVLPAGPQELKALEREFGGSHACINGKYMHITVWSRPDLGYATTRNARYTPIPSRVTFNRTNRIKRYLYYHPHRPFMYPRMPLHGFHIIRNNYDTPHFAEIKITNHFAVFPDADHAGDQRTRRSLSSILVALVGVAVDYKMEQQGCMSLSSTDAEIHSTFAGVKRAVYFFEMAKFLDMPNAGKPIRIYQDSQPCIDILTSGAVSKRVKHIAVPVHYVYEKVVKGIVDMEHIPTALQPADPGTKPTSAPVSFRAYDYATGVRFYPPADSEHAKLMDLVTYNAARTFTIPNPSDDTPTPAPTVTAKPDVK